MVDVFAITGHTNDADTLRALAYSIYKKPGPVGPLDLRVRQLAIPGNGVRATLGQIVVMNKTKDRQAYFSEVDVEPHVTGMSASGAKYDMVVWEVRDFEAAGQGHPNLGAAGPYGGLRVYTDIETNYGVDGDTVDSFDDLGVDNNCFGLAVVHWTGVGATVTDAMIRDIRTELAAPVQEHFATKRTVGSNQNVSTGAIAKWPTEADFTVRVPTWATKADIKLRAVGVLLATGSVSVDLELRLGATVVEAMNIASTSAAVVPGDFEIGDTINITSAMRGQLLDLELWGHRVSGAGNATAVAGMRLNYTINWGQHPVSS